MMSFKLLILIVVLLLITNLIAQEKPVPDSSNCKYGMYDLNTYDLWLAKSSTPVPLVIYFHGGSLTSGDKGKISANMINSLLERGVSVMTANYRLTPEVVYPQHYKDCARAIQYIRYNAKKLNIDPGHIAIYGSSAGACASLWIGFHDDLAEPVSADPVLQMSTRVNCVAMFSGQSTLDIDVVRAEIAELAFSQSMFNGKIVGLKKEELETEKAKQLYKEASPTTYLTKDDPPVWAYYSVAKEAPKTVSDAIHHYNFGVYLKQKMDAVGVECTLRSREDSSSVNSDCINFFCRHLNVNQKKK